MSEEDCERAIQAGSPKERTYAVPNGVDLDRFRPAEERSDVPEVFYVGSFRHLPNIIGYERLRHEIMPQVWSKIPHARLRVVPARILSATGKSFSIAPILPRTLASRFTRL